MRQRIFFLGIVIILIGCSMNKASYIGTGAVIGGGAGYGIHENEKEAMIGGLAGGIAGAVVGDMQTKKINKKMQEAYEEGYTQAQADVAIEYWDQNTGRPKETRGKPKLKRVKVEEQEVNGVRYKEHYEYIEVYP